MGAADLLGRVSYAKFKIVLFKILGGDPWGSPMSYAIFLWDRSAPRIKDSAPLGIQEKERPHRYEADRFIHREIL
jgi:hypothetical protein